MSTEEFEQFKAVLRQLVTELEDIWCEAEGYRTLLVTMGVVTPDSLKGIARNALDDPHIRERARKRFHQIDHALNQAGDALWFADFLRKSPGSGEPN